MSVPVSVAVEGDIDEAVAHRLLAEVGGEASAVRGRRGKSQLVRNLGGYNAAALRLPWLVLIDLDNEPCPVDYATAVLPAPASMMCRRVVVREIEAWLLADRSGFASWAGVSVARVPADAEALVDPKRSLVNVVRGSRNRNLRNDIVPRPTSGRSVGAGYNSRLREFVATHWDLQAALRNSDSLWRAYNCLQKLIQGAIQQQQDATSL
jgi:hypothetical protein